MKRASSLVAAVSELSLPWISLILAVSPSLAASTMSPNWLASCFSPSANDCAWVFTSSGGCRPSILLASLSRRSLASSPLLAIFSVDDRSIEFPALFVAAQMLSSAAAYAAFEPE